MMNMQPVIRSKRDNTQPLCLHGQHILKNGTLALSLMHSRSGIKAISLVHSNLKQDSSSFRISELATLREVKHGIACQCQTLTRRRKTRWEYSASKTLGASDVDAAPKHWQPGTRRQPGLSSLLMTLTLDLLVNKY